MSALNGIRIVELAESVAGEYCGKLLADFGAEVIKVEPPGSGCATRAMAPQVAMADRAKPCLRLPQHEQEVRHVTRHATADPHDILASADAVIDDHVRVPDLASRHPDVVFCSITPFGQGAPADLQNAKSINVFHASGWGYHTPSHPDPAKPPLKGPGRFLADYEAGLDAALCVASSLFARLHHGDGEFIDRLRTSGAGFARRLHTGPVRHGRDRAGEHPRRLRPAGPGVVLRMPRRARLPVHDEPKPLGPTQTTHGPSALARRIRR